MEPQGARLKKIRQELGLSLEEAQKKTKIHLNILKAIEGDSLTDLSPIYLKGFLKIYCKFLGVDPKEYIQDYRETSPPSNVIVTKGVKTAAGKLHFLKTASKKIALGDDFLRFSVVRKVFYTFLHHKKYKSALVFVLVIILLSFGLYNLGKALSSKHKARITKARPSYFMPGKKEIKKEKKAKNAPAVTQAAMLQKDAATVAKKDTASGIRLNIRASENCWVDLKADGRVVFHRVLEKGRFETWQAKERIELSLGNAGAIELEVNGQRFLNLGRRGQALKGIVITKDGLNISR